MRLEVGLLLMTTSRRLRAHVAALQRGPHLLDPHTHTIGEPLHAHMPRPRRESRVYTAPPDPARVLSEQVDAAMAAGLDVEERAIEGRRGRDAG